MCQGQGPRSRFFGFCVLATQQDPGRLPRARRDVRAEAPRAPGCPEEAAAASELCPHALGPLVFRWRLEASMHDDSPVQVAFSPLHFSAARWGRALDTLSQRREKPVDKCPGLPCHPVPQGLPVGSSPSHPQQLLAQ